MRIAILAALAIVAGMSSTTLSHSQPPARRVAIAPVEVAFDKEWLSNMNGWRDRTHPVSEADARRIAADLAGDLQKALDEAVRARGFEVVTSPSTGAWRLDARIVDLYVNAPDVRGPGITQAYVREAGRATLRAEGRDVSGTVRIQSERHGTAGDHGRLERASEVTNRFYFDVLFRSWAREVAAELGTRAAP